MLDSFDGLVAALPGWEDPLFRFLEGRGELQQADRFMVFTLWKLLLDSDVRYPVWLAGRLFERVDLLDAAFNCLGGARRHGQRSRRCRRRGTATKELSTWGETWQGSIRSNSGEAVRDGEVRRVDIAVIDSIALARSTTRSSA